MIFSSVVATIGSSQSGSKTPVRRERRRHKPTWFAAAEPRQSFAAARGYVPHGTAIGQGVLDGTRPNLHPNHLPCEETPYGETAKRKGRIPLRRGSLR